MVALRISLALLTCVVLSFGQGSEIAIAGLEANVSGPAGIWIGPDGTTVSIDWDQPPEKCLSGLYQWTGDGLQCVGQIVQADGVPRLDSGLRTAVLESQRDYHVSTQNMYAAQVSWQRTLEYLDFKNKEEFAKQLSEAMETLQNRARAICAAEGTEYQSSSVSCIKTESAMAKYAKALAVKEGTKE